MKNERIRSSLVLAVVLCAGCAQSHREPKAAADTAIDVQIIDANYRSLIREGDPPIEEVDEPVPVVAGRFAQFTVVRAVGRNAVYFETDGSKQSLQPVIYARPGERSGQKLTIRKGDRFFVAYPYLLGVLGDQFEFEYVGQYNNLLRFDVYQYGSVGFKWEMVDVKPYELDEPPNQ